MYFQYLEQCWQLVHLTQCCLDKLYTVVYNKWRFFPISPLLAPTILFSFPRGVLCETLFYILPIFSLSISFFLNISIPFFGSTYWKYCFCKAYTKSMVSCVAVCPHTDFLVTNMHASTHTHTHLYLYNIFCPTPPSFTPWQNMMNSFLHHIVRSHSL